MLTGPAQGTEPDFTVPSLHLRGKGTCSPKPLLLQLGVASICLQWQLPARRKRGTISCNQCRRQKARCDREKPCGRCTGLGKGKDCTYQGDVGFPGSTQPRPSDPLKMIATTYFDTKWDQHHRNQAHWVHLIHAVRCLHALPKEMLIEI